jgi:hypothetical protein
LLDHLANGNNGGGEQPTRTTGMDKNKPQYLGDGLYAKFDGYQIYLMANSHTHPTDTVALDGHTLAAFLKYVKQLEAEEGEKE